MQQWQRQVPVPTQMTTKLQTKNAYINVVVSLIEYLNVEMRDIQLTTRTIQVLSLSAPQHPIKAIMKTSIPTTIKRVAGEK